MKEQSPIELPAPLTEIPMLAEYEAELAAPTAEPAADNAARGHPFGIYSSHELRSSRTQWPTSDLDWAQVVELRRRASEMITDEIQEHVGRHGRPLGTDDRLLLGRAIIRRVVADHVRSLHRSGAELWSPTQEEAYVTAVENAVFGYGRLQPLLDMPDVENIEIHGWDSVVV
ncbi:MAG TPA: secretion protein, partial [Propionibacteriaceae bacterium]|nr:secretion protein [Propionibacteriaceae bacterium]